MRRAFAETLLESARQNEKVIFLTGDLGFQVFDDFVAEFGPRYVNVGIAEAQLVNTAVGLALEGWRPIIYSIAPFVTARPYEQIRFGASYHNLPVMIVGAGGGFTYANAGPTHHAPDDLTLMSALPRMTVVAPGGPMELANLMPQMLELPGPSYLRVGKFGEPDVMDDSPITLGKARQLKSGHKIAVATLGDVVADIQPMLEKLYQEGITPGLFHFHTVKPIDLDTFNYIGNHYKTLLIIEESIPQGGLFHEACVWKATADSSIKIVRLGAPDNFILGSPKRDELRAAIGIDSSTVKKILVEKFQGI